MQAQEDSRIIGARLRTVRSLWSMAKKATMPADRFLSRFFFQNRKKIGSRDRKFLSETIYNAFRHKTFLELWLREVLPRQNRVERDEDELFCILAAAKLGFVSESLFEELGLGEGVYSSLREHVLPPNFVSSSPEETLAAVYSFPLWLVTRWTGRYGVEPTERLLKFFLSRPLLSIRVNPLKTSREKLIALFQKSGIASEPAKRSPYGLLIPERNNVPEMPAFREGHFEVQDEGSQLVCQKTEAKPGEFIWDVCAGGGGKSLLLAAMMENRGRIVATDIRAHKLDELKKRAKRAGAFNIFPTDLNRVNELAVTKKGFDKILVDAPCSGTGTLARNPDAKWRMDESWLQKFPAEQTEIIEKALPYLKKNGKLYYATCSLEPAENERVVEKILETHPEIKCLPCGVSGENFFRLWPPESKTDGFFMAIMEKTQ
ncbi:MAG: RsmB/NOP family class I SAM-dependent RNA methyltransferase [Candidatus Omnitrophota bacterium]|jgi:16S rRNA (cytosine967-C5)-methyltransferase